MKDLFKTTGSYVLLARALEADAREKLSGPSTTYEWAHLGTNALRAAEYLWCMAAVSLLLALSKGADVDDRTVVPLRSEGFLTEHGWGPCAACRGAGTVDQAGHCCVICSGWGVVDTGDERA